MIQIRLRRQLDPRNQEALSEWNESAMISPAVHAIETRANAIRIPAAALLSISMRIMTCLVEDVLSSMLDRLLVVVEAGVVRPQDAVCSAILEHCKTPRSYDEQYEGEQQDRQPEGDQDRSPPRLAIGICVCVPGL